VRQERALPSDQCIMHTSGTLLLRVACSSNDGADMPAHAQEESNTKTQHQQASTKRRPGRAGGAVAPRRKSSNRAAQVRYRAAQVRYREKRKAQAAELEEQVAVLTTELAHMEAVQSENARLRDALARAQERGAAPTGVAGVATGVNGVDTDIEFDVDGNVVEAKRERDVAAYDEAVAHQLVIRGRMQQLLEAAGVSVAAVTCVSCVAVLQFVLRR
jgi:hypothetical protein